MLNVKKFGISLYVTKVPTIIQIRNKAKNHVKVKIYHRTHNVVIHNNKQKGISQRFSTHFHQNRGVSTP